MFKKFTIIITLLFFVFLNQKIALAHSVEDFPKLPESVEQKIFRDFEYRISQDSNRRFNIDSSHIKYLVYRTQQYYQDKRVHVIPYICEYSVFKNNYEVRSVDDCGSHLTYDKNSGKYTISIISAYYNKMEYSLKEKKLIPSGDSYVRTIHSDTYQKVDLTYTTDPDFFILMLDTFNRVNQFNIRPSDEPVENQGSANQGDWLSGLTSGFTSVVTGIVDGISSFLTYPFEKIIDFITFIKNLITQDIPAFFSSLFTLNNEDWKKINDKFNQTFERIPFVNSIISSVRTLYTFVNYNSNISESCTLWSFQISNNPLGGFSINLCAVPQELRLIARALAFTALFFIVVARIGKFVDILFGRIVHDFAENGGNK